MAGIIQFSSGAKKREKNRDLTDLLREATSKTNEASLLKDCSVLDRSKFKRLMESRIMRGIVEKREISTSSFLCGLYSAEVLTNFLRTIDGDLDRLSQMEKFSETGNPYYYQRAGDHLFFTCAVFPENADRLRRQLTLQDYYDMGARCYYNFYDLTGTEIGYHMSQMFTPLANIVHQYVLNPKE